MCLICAANPVDFRSTPVRLSLTFFCKHCLPAATGAFSNPPFGTNCSKNSHWVQRGDRECSACSRMSNNSSWLSWFLYLSLFPALPEFPLGSSLPCWRPSPPPTSSSHGRWRGHAQWAVRHAATRRPAGRWGENNALAASHWFELWWRTDTMARLHTSSQRLDWTHLNAYKWQARVFKWLEFFNMTNIY